MKTLLLLLSAVLAIAFAPANSEKKADTSYIISFDANTTTGYNWTAFILGGDSVEIDDKESGYVSDPNPGFLDGVGGTHYFKLKPLHEGETIIRFTYSRGLDDIAEETIMLISVDENMNIHTMDVTESGVIEGSVTEVMEKDHSVLMDNEQHGEIIVRFDENEALPANEEQIRIYTNGTMTMSLPAIMNAIAWESIPSEYAR